MTDELMKIIQRFGAAHDAEISISNKKYLVCEVKCWNAEGNYWDSTDVWFSKAELKAALPLLIQIIDVLEE